ncbi:hypothetical protein [Flavobacterium notoginsengisoli]|uniref:hypothetical protein n=1 Tax=Flavobacterium notoginsengisoli TaxID=1478199 RepID=UPI00362D3CFC
MIIYPLVIIEQKDNVRIQASFETSKEKGILWYDFPKEYKEYLVVENSDAFLIGLLPVAMKMGEDLYIKNKISTRLFYNVTTYLIPALVLSNNDFKGIKIIPEVLNDENLNIAKAVATGASCGIDSTATIFEHLKLKYSYSLNHLTYLDAGSHGQWNGEIAKKTFKDRVKRVKSFSSELNLPLVEIKSNIGEILGNDFQKTHSLRNLSCILNLQKMFKTYYYASAYRFDFFKIDKNDTSSWDILITRFISTESLEFISSMSHLNRIERTKLISEFSPAFHFLDVCTAPDFEDKINCSKCDKCMRTQLTLDVIGKLDNFNSVFNVEKYNAFKDEFIGKVIVTKNKNQINLEIYDFLNQNNTITLTNYLYALKYQSNLLKNKFKKRVKTLFRS